MEQYKRINIKCCSCNKSWSIDLTGEFYTVEEYDELKTLATALCEAVRKFVDERNITLDEGCGCNMCQMIRELAALEEKLGVTE